MHRWQPCWWWTTVLWACNHDLQYIFLLLLSSELMHICDTQQLKCSVCPALHTWCVAMQGILHNTRSTQSTVLCAHHSNATVPFGLRGMTLGTCVQLCVCRTCGTCSIMCMVVVGGGAHQPAAGAAATAPTHWQGSPQHGCTLEAHV